MVRGEAHDPLAQAVQGQALLPVVPQCGVPPGAPLEGKPRRDLADDEQQEKSLSGSPVPPPSHPLEGGGQLVAAKQAT